MGKLKVFFTDLVDAFNDISSFVDHFGNLAQGPAISAILDGSYVLSRNRHLRPEKLI